jgi:hypothetical protein
MIRMQQPSISINSHDVPGPHYRMWKTIEAAEGTTASDVARMIESMNISALLQDDTPLRNIILNCHGFPGGLCGWAAAASPNRQVERRGLRHARPLQRRHDLARRDAGPALGTAGQDFCQTLAKVAKTTVIASDGTISPSAPGARGASPSPG